MTCHVTTEPKSGYRQCVGIVLISATNSIWVGRRSDMNVESWQMPQGGIDRGETPEAAGLREMAEEIGTKRATLLAVSNFWRSYDLPPNIAKRLWRGRFQGQSQKWLAYRFDGADGDIDLDTETPEFDQWQWVREAELLDLIVWFKRDVYLSVFDEFRHLWA
ncbi:MAG: RNA pyrophosphohydrolase [Pseudomonadota bacterium]